MIDNTLLLRKLLDKKLIALEDGSFLSSSPAPLPADFDFERIEGMLLGLAIGDSLGNTSESINPVTRYDLHGEIRDYRPNRYNNDLAIGLPSDDTQMSFWTLEQLLDDGGLVPEHLADSFSRQIIFGMGSTVREFLRAYKDRHKPWYEAGQASAGNGALMRIAPILLPHLRQPSPALWADAALAGMVTHNDRASNTCCIAFTHLLWECLRLKETPEPVWWIDTFSAAACQLEGRTLHKPRSENIAYIGPLWKFADEQVRQALAEDLPVLEACNRWYSGAYLLETMTCVLYILARYAGSPEEAIVRAVNDTRDNDTIASIVGAAVGALHGSHKLPERWVKLLSGRTGSNDDGYIFKLIDKAESSFWVS